MSDTAFQALLYGLILALPLSVLAARRVPSTIVIRYAAVWIVVFGMGMLVVHALSIIR